jgi:hypothetical protein
MEEEIDVEPNTQTSIENPGIPKERTGRRSLSKLRRELSEEELASSGVQKVLLDEIDRLETDNSKMISLQEDYQKISIDLARLKEKYKNNSSMDIIHIACISLGGISAGYAPSVWNSQPTGWIALIIGVILISVGISAKAIKL